MTINDESVAPLTDEKLETLKAGSALKRVSTQVEGLRSGSAIQQMQGKIQALLSNSAMAQTWKHLDALRSSSAFLLMQEQAQALRASSAMDQTWRHLEAVRSSSDLLKIQERTQALLSNSALAQTSSHLEALRSSSALLKMQEQAQTLLSSSAVTQVLRHLEALHSSSALELTGDYYGTLQKTIRNSRLAASLSIDDLLAELQARGVDFADPPETVAEQFKKRVECEGITTATASATGSAQVDSINPLSFALLPTWLVLTILTVLVNALIHWNDLREGICDINGRIPPTESLASARKFVRVKLCGFPIADARIVKGDNVNLRSDPSMKSNVIMQLKKNQVVAVVSRENRRWLLVSFKRDGLVIEGWVSRSYLKKV